MKEELNKYIEKACGVTKKKKKLIGLLRKHYTLRHTLVKMLLFSR